VTTLVERQTATKTEDLELAGLLLSTLRIIKMATAASREHSHVVGEPRRRDVAASRARDAERGSRAALRHDRAR